MSNEITPVIHPTSLYDYTAGVSCGVLVTERVMKKLAKLQAEHVRNVKRLLSDNKDEVFPSMWTLHYPGGKQTNVTFIAVSESLDQRIASAVMMRQPEHCPLVFVADSMAEAGAMADAHHAETEVAS